MALKLEFNITGVPPTTEDIREEIAHQKRKLWGYNLFAALMSVLVAYALAFIAESIKVLFDQGLTAPDVATLAIKNVSLKGVAILSSLISGVPFLLNINRFAEGKHNLTALDLPRCEQALKLSAHYPEINAYRLAVIKQRQLTNADLDAIERFPEEQERQLAEDNLQLTFEALHKP